MASTFSTSLRLELIGDGDQSGIWGQTTNTNLGTLLEQAVTGVTGITMLDANYTLSNYNGVSDESRNAVLVVTGTNTAQRNIVAPLVNKLYTIKNSTTGGYGVQIIGSSGTGVVIPNGATASVYCDGTNFYAAQVNTVGNETINGNLTVTGTTALNGATTMSSALTYGGVVLANAVTGTGNMVLSASPTLTGVPLSTTAATGTNTTQIATTAFVQASTAALGLGTMATQNANAVAITGGTMTGMTSIAGGTVAGTTGTFSSTVSGTTITASTQFSGPGTGLTGTAASLSIGGSAATATNSTNATNATNLTGSGTISSTTTGITQPLGTNNTTIATTAFALANGIPSGAIVMWSGSIASIPSGWLLCNGSSGTPDLRDRFVVGAGSTYAVAATGGSANATLVSHTHTATDSGHTHTTPVPYKANGLGSGPYAMVDGSAGISGYSNITSSTGTANVTNSTEGSSATNANLPPYYALAYIMKS